MAARHENYRFKCVNPNGCNYEGLKRLKLEDFERSQYRGGFPCEKCGYPRMAVIRSNKMVKDSFVAGYQRSIRKHCETYAEYQRELKKRGLIEIGYEEINPDTEAGRESVYWDDAIIRGLYKRGIKISGNEAKALKEGLT